PGMAAGLHAAFPTFAAGLDAALAALEPGLGARLRTLLLDADPDDGSAAGELASTELTQPALFCFEAALHRLLSEDVSLRPDYVIGHSIGELAAACAAGVVSLADGARLAAERGRLMAERCERGAMVAVAADPDVVEARLEAEPELSLAAVNGPRACTVAGPEAALEAWAERFADESGARLRRLHVSHAFHSTLVEPALAELEEVCRGLALEPAAIPIAANLTGAIAEPEELADPGYWARQARSPVRFAPGIRALRDAGVARFVELGPDATLATLADGVLADAEGEPPLVAALDVRQRGADAIGELVGRLAVDGLDPDPAPLFADRPHGLCELPTYPFERRHYWIRATSSAAAVASAGLEPADHPLVGAVVELAAGGGALATARLDPGAVGWLGEHRVAEQVIVPGALIAELSLAATAGDALALEELTLEAPLRLDDSAVPLQLRLEAPGPGGERAFSLHARAGEDGWSRHASGTLSAVSPPPPAPLDGAWPPDGAEPLDPDALYAQLLAQGLAYGPAFQGVRRGWRAAGGEVLAEVELAPAEAAGAQGHLIHPALLDACLHPISWAHEGASGPLLPFALSGLAVHRPGAGAVRVRVRRVERDGEGGPSDSFAVEAFTAGGEPVFTLERVDLRPLPAAALGPAAGGELLAFEWRVLTRVDGEAGAE
ncbi:MAG TPA: acyltransferase domain-containing protein, partial [Thermoleophilaceae bacterium]